jgi:protein Tex
VMSCVNAVGVELNTASIQLLSYVSGLGPALAENIVKHRDTNGPFPFREALKAVRRLGPKAFEQAAGFLRLRESANPLDASAVHPESYAIVEKMALDQDCSVRDLMQDEIRRKKIILTDYVTDKVGLPTLQDILTELARPGRDPRAQFENVVFAEGIDKIEDLAAGMKLTGVVTNITAFGAFVDIGVHQDGLIHLSEMADRYVKSASDVVKVNQKVEVTVLGVDVSRKRISLSIKKTPGENKVVDKKEAADPKAQAQYDKSGSPPRFNQGKKPQSKATEPFNNPFVEALRRR